MKNEIAPAAPLPSRRERKKQRTRGEIYQAAMQLFAERSYDSVSVEAICQQADVARTTFFAHFPSKADLLREYSRGIVSRFRALALAPDTTATAQLRALSDIVMESWFEKAEILGAMLLEQSIPAARHFDDDAVAEPLHPLVSGIIELGRERGEFRPGATPEVAAAIFLNAGAIVLISARARGADLDPEALRAEFLDFVLHGLCT